jgi:heterodisulfide reductase subunit A-like polyferredoxin
MKAKTSGAVMVVAVGVCGIQRAMDLADIGKERAML